MTAAPAVLTGAAQALKLIQKQGLYEADKKTIHPKVKTVLTHASLTDVTLAAAGYIWYLRRAAIEGNLVEKVSGLATEQAYRPENWMVGVETVVLGIFFYALNLGGALTYNYGMGLSLAKSAKKDQ